MKKSYNNIDDAVSEYEKETGKKVSVKMYWKLKKLVKNK